MHYQVYAVEYARKHAVSHENFYGHADPHETNPMPLSYYVWVARSDSHTVLIDTGFTAEVAAKRGRQHLRCPIAALSLLGIRPEMVNHVVLTHFHYDHAGNIDKLPGARFYVQDAEMAFWTGRYASRGAFRGLVEVNDVVSCVQMNFEGRLRFVDGAEEILPGISVHRVGGHSAGLQVVRVQTATGPLVLASDAAHFYRNFLEDRPFSIVHNLADMYGAFDQLRALAGDEQRVVPGHDPLVMTKFPAASPELQGIAVVLADP